MGFSCKFHESSWTLIKFSWEFHGSFVEVHSSFMNLSWKFLEVSFKFHGIFMEFSANYHRNLMVFSWYSHGILMEAHRIFVSGLQRTFTDFHGLL